MNKAVLVKVQKVLFFIALLFLPFLTIRLEGLMQSYGHIMNAFFLDKLTAFIIPLGIILALLTQVIFGHFFS
jgi:hypothetical protein